MKRVGDVTNGHSISDQELLADDSALKTCGNEEVARQALAAFNHSLRNGLLSFKGLDLIQDVIAKSLKVIGRFATLKGLLPTRSSALPITELDLSGNALFTHLGSQEDSANGKATLKRRVETVQLVVQFVRVSTEAKIVLLEDCGLQGISHDKCDLIEQEIIRLVKKFGVAKQSRYTSKVSLAGNMFRSEFLKKIIEGAFWERNRFPNKDDPPKLFLDMSRNQIQDPDRVIDELRAGRSAGGPIGVASSTDPEDVREKALIVVDVHDQRGRSKTPPTGARRPLVEQLQHDRLRMKASYVSRRRSPSGESRYSRSLSRQRSRRPSPSRSYSRRRCSSRDGCDRAQQQGRRGRGEGGNRGRREPSCSASRHKFGKWRAQGERSGRVRQNSRDRSRSRVVRRGLGGRRGRSRSIEPRADHSGDRSSASR